MTRYEEYFQDFWQTARNVNGPPVGLTSITLHVRCKERQRGYPHEIVIRSDGSVTFQAHAHRSKAVLALCAEECPEGYAQSRGCYKVAQLLRPGSTSVPDKSELTSFMPRSDAALLQRYLQRLGQYRYARWVYRELDVDPLLKTHELSKKTRWQQVLAARLLREKAYDLDRLRALSTVNLRLPLLFNGKMLKGRFTVAGRTIPSGLHDYLYKLRDDVIRLP